jgi:hypothetical protein
MEARNKAIKDGFIATKDSLSSIVDIASQYTQHQSKNKELSADQLKNLSEKLKTEKENLKLSQESLIQKIKSNQAEKDRLSGKTPTPDMTGMRKPIRRAIGME